MYWASTLGATWPTRYTPRHHGMRTPFSSRPRICLLVTPAASSCRRVTTPSFGLAKEAITCSTVLTFGPIWATKQDSPEVRPSSDEKYPLSNGRFSHWRRRGAGLAPERRLPRGRVDRARRLPRGAAGEAGAGRGPRRRRQDR